MRASRHGVGRESRRAHPPSAAATNPRWDGGKALACRHIHRVVAGWAHWRFEGDRARLEARQSDDLRPVSSSLPHHLAQPTQECEPIIEAPPPLVEALVRDCEPLYLVRQHLVAAFTKYCPQCPVEQFRVLVALPAPLGPSWVVQRDRRFHSGGSARPARRRSS